MSQNANTNPTADSLGDTIRKAREAKRLSAEGLAFKAGVSMRTISRLEADQVVPRRSTLKVIADVLEIDPASLAPLEEAA